MKISTLQAIEVKDLKEKEIFTNLSKKEKRLLKIKYTCSKCNKIFIVSFSSFEKKDSFLCHYCIGHSKKNHKEIREKSKKTCLERYGVISNLSTLSKERKERGELIGAANPKIKEKMKQTNIEKYGINSSSPFARKEIQESIKNIFLEKYGVDHNFKINSLIEKRSNNKKIQNQFFRNSKEYQIRFIQNYIENKYMICLSTYIKDNEIFYRIQCSRCNNIFEWSIKNRLEGENQYPFCKKCNYSGKSKEEKFLLEFIKSIYNGEIIENDRKILSGKEIDIYIPEFKLGIEYHGLYWHSGDKTKHREKWELAQEKNIDLIQMWSSEWRDKQEICKSIIKNRLGLSTPIYARKCEIREVSIKEVRNFANTYHLQGFCAGEKYIGLYYQGNLIDLSIFCKCRFGKQYSWELTRHIIKHGYRVIGGLSREISYFRKLGYTGSIVDYCDMRWFNGKGHWGFEEIGITPPDLCYTDFYMVIPRGKYQKKRMKNIIGFKFNENLSQRENLLNNKMDFIYGVGHKIFVLK
jgi:DNA-directed RNA polymerase subunit RPC12/RpoP